MHNPFAKKESASNLALSFETKTAVMPEMSDNAPLPKRIEALRKQATDLEVKLKSDLEKIWSFFGGDRQEAYYQKRVLSYSFLKHVENVRYSKPQYGDKQRNFDLGMAFEDMLTDCLNVAKFPNLTTDDFLQLQRMCEVAKKNEWIIDFLQNCDMQKEFEGVIKGYKFKAKLDFYNRELDYIGDLKTTSAQTLNAFKKACIDFGYYTQGVIYGNLANTEPIEDFYIIAGVSKKKDLVFIVSMNESDCEVGNKDLDHLLENLTYFGIADNFKA
jgi:hypothetical protein